LRKIFSPDETHYGSYWKVPDGVKVDGANISLNEKKLTGRSDGDIDQGRREHVEEVFPKLKSMEVTSVILGCTHPNYFGVYSPPVLTLLQLPMQPPVKYFLRYCDELREWGREHLRSASALRTDRALWVFYQEAYGHEQNKDKASRYRDSFEQDEWVRKRHAQNVLRPYFKDYRPLEQAKFLLELVAKIPSRRIWRKRGSSGPRKSRLNRMGFSPDAA